MNWRKPLIYSALYLSGSNIPRNLREIRRAAALPAPEKLRYQNEKLSALLLHASKHVPYYARVLKEAGVVDGVAVDLSRFSAIPILTKDIIRREGENMFSDDRSSRKFYENTSGGSTGEPVRFLQDKVYSDWNIANKIYYKELGGQDMGERELRFWGSERDLLEGKESFKIRARNWLYNRAEFNSFRMSEAQMRDYVDKWNAFQPHWVESYVQSIYEFARFLNDNNLRVHAPHGILTSAGTLYPEMRELIERVISSTVYNRYGSREVGDMACGIDTLQVSFWNNKLETIDSPDDTPHKIVVTNLNNYSMPLIRYAIGDVGELGNDGLQVNAIQGRVNNILRTSKGSIDSTAITSALYFDLENNLFTSFSKYQLIQKDTDSFVLRVVVTDSEKWQKDKQTIEFVMKKILGETITFVFQEEEEIQAQANGKYEYIRSEVV